MTPEVFLVFLIVHQAFITLYISRLPLAHTVLVCKLYEDTPSSRHCIFSCWKTVMRNKR